MNLQVLQTIAITLLELALCYGVGRVCYAVVRLKPSLLHHSVAPLLGLIILALQLWLFGLVHVPWNSVFLCVPWILIGMLARKRLGLSPKSPIHTAKFIIRQFLRLDLFAKILIILGCMALGIFLLTLTVSPLISSDTMGFWALKAKEFLYHRSVFVDPFLYKTPEAGQFYHVDYPPLWPLMADVGYVLVGHIQEGLQKTTSWVICVSLVTATWAFAWQYTKNATRATVFAFIVLAAPQFLNVLFFPKNMGYADYPLAASMACASMFLLQSLRSSKPNVDWLLALIFAVSASVIKNEGVAFLILVGIVLAIRLGIFVYRQRQWRAVFICLICTVGCLLPIILWTIYKNSHHLQIEFTYHNLTSSGMTAFQRLQIVGQEVGRFLQYQTAYWWEVAALVIGIIGVATLRTKQSFVMLFLIIGMLGAYTTSFIFSAHDVGVHVATSIDRLFTQLVPLLVIMCVILCGAANDATSKNISAK